MTISLWRLGDAAGEARATFLDLFAGGIDGRSDCRVDGGGAADGHGPPAGRYTRAVLDAAAGRPHELVLACEGGRVLGRAMVATSYARPATATVGLLRTGAGGSGRAAGAALLADACAWAARTGHTRIFGPMDLTTWFDYRLMLTPEGDGAGVPSFAWEPPHRPSQLELFRDAGFDEAERYRSIGTIPDATDRAAIRAAVGYTARAHDAAVVAGYTFVRLETLEQFSRLLDELHPLCIEAFRGSPLFEPLPPAAFRALYGAAAAARDCTLTHVVRDVDGGLAGFAFAFVDGDAVVVKTIAVSPRSRGRHLSTALTHLILARGAELGHRAFVSALVRRGNTSELLARPHIAAGIPTWTREYVLLHRMVP